MNEMDLTTKIEGLKKAIAEHNDFAGNYASDLAKCEQELKDYNKPELTPSQLDDIHEAVENAVNDFNFEDTDNYNIEYGIDYDGKVNCESFEFQDSYELVEKIVTKVCNLFKEADSPTDEENARDDKEAEELADNS
jgi:Tfp pilus assembly pilus retraction ATPase PilT